MFKQKWVIWLALAQAAVLESIRRKDLYVAGILAVLMIGAAAMIGKFGVDGLEIFLKSVTLTVINILSVILAVLFSARQMPEEISRRTVYPLLARPISRGDLIFGKFLGAYALSLIGLAVFAAVGWGALTFYGLHPGTIFWQYLLLRAALLFLVCALTLTLSVFLTVQATVTISLLLTIGSQAFSQSVLLLDKTMSGTSQLVLRGVYFVLPELNLFDLTNKVSYGWKPIGVATILALFAYAALHTTVSLTVGTLRFRRQAL